MVKVLRHCAFEASGRRLFGGFICPVRRDRGWGRGGPQLPTCKSCLQVASFHPSPSPLPSSPVYALRGVRSWAGTPFRAAGDRLLQLPARSQLSSASSVQSPVSFDGRGRAGSAVNMRMTPARVISTAETGRPTALTPRMARSTSHWRKTLISLRLGGCERGGSCCLPQFQGA